MTKQRATNPFDLSFFDITKFYVVGMASISVMYLILTFFWGDMVLLEFSDIQGRGSSIGAGLSAVWFIFVWGALATLTNGWFTRRQRRTHEPLEVLVKGWWISLHAGFFEELMYRWLTFFMAMITLPFINWCTFGLLKWSYVTILVPFANWATFGALEPQLLGHTNWVFGAAIASTSLSFQAAHKGHGLIGWINSWFIGLVMFYLVFNFGIVTAIIAHVVYDMVVFAAMAVTYSWRSRRSVVHA